MKRPVKPNINDFTTQNGNTFEIRLDDYIDALENHCDRLTHMLDRLIEVVDLSGICPVGIECPDCTCHECIERYLLELEGLNNELK